MHGYPEYVGYERRALQWFAEGELLQHCPLDGEYDDSEADRATHRWVVRSVALAFIACAAGLYLAI